MAEECPSDPNGAKRDVKSAELNIRLELEHDRCDQTTTNQPITKQSLHNKCLSYRRVRAQEAIGEIEKERILLKQKLDIRNSDYEQKAQVRYTKLLNWLMCGDFSRI